MTEDREEKLEYQRSYSIVSAWQSWLTSHVNSSEPRLPHVLIIETWAKSHHQYFICINFCANYDFSLIQIGNINLSIYRIQEAVLKHPISIPPNQSTLLCIRILINKPLGMNVFHWPLQIPFTFFHLALCPKRLTCASLPSVSLLTLIKEVGEGKEREV